MHRRMTNPTRLARRRCVGGVRREPVMVGVRHYTSIREDYEWPTLYEEAHEMMLASSLSYPITHLLREARAGRLPGSGRILDKLKAVGDGDLATALTPNEFLGIIRDHKDHIAKTYPMEAEQEFGWYKVLELYEQQQQALEGDDDDVQLMEFDDQQENTRLVYGIGVHRKRKRITVIFRGTYAEGTSDWTRNLQFNQVELPVPGLFDTMTPTTTSRLCVHRGIYEYLLHNSKRGEDYPRERYEEIVGHLRSAAEQHPGYKIYATGHSLGGALAALLSFYAAADDRLPQPITCVSLGSLLLGDHSLKVAAQNLESAGRLRHLRITNEHDPVPCLPPFGWYQPFGVHLHLCEAEGYGLSYPESDGAERNGSMARFQELWRSYRTKGSLDRWIASHSVPEHLRRLEREKDSLQTKTLNECYNFTRSIIKRSGASPADLESVTQRLGLRK